ncbi:MAG TPA: replicative DNA helicase [Acidimicrobiales bacterium]|nr:replicative DNA helicase [Acidimicrobiales bacterium]
MTQAVESSRVRRLTPAGGRIPPHDLDAEESLLGAMLLSRDAIAAAVESCVADDFYKPAHAHIFAAVTALYTRGEPADPVTVADELRRGGVLEAVGDPSVLISLQVNTPSTANAAHYARIVEEHALLRRMVSVAGEIAELGYSVPEDVTEVIDRAESMVFEVAQRRVVDTMSSLRDLLSASLDHLENLYARGETITGVPTGYTDLDERLAGLQRSNLVVVGARPAMGKALALDTPIPTPGGWTDMGELAVGDVVFDERGVPCRVDYVSPVFRDRPCYRVCFDDGSEIVADGEHRWMAYDLPAWKSHRSRAERLARGLPDHPGLSRDQSDRWCLPRVVTTEQILAEGIRTPGDDRPNWYVALAGALDTREVELPVDPYVLGRGLGDGQPLPEDYLRSSPKQRLAILQGVMDTHGCVTNANGTVEICLADRDLLEHVRELACSLGHKPCAIRRRTVRLADGRQSETWRCRWTPLDPVFRLPHKADRLNAQASTRRNGRHTRRAIVAVEPVESVPTRCIAVSSTSHLFLAGRSMIPTHNTSFALGIVSHAAVHARTPVLLFSLEMSHLELTQRLLCSEARVDATRMRNGRLLESDWPKISDAIGRLGDAPIYIDDNPNITVMDIRAKARRLKARQGLGLVVVDYLQLMSGHAKSRAENRQVEVSEISRGLKVLARELEIPVVALSQLSRNLEMRQDKRPVLADLRESGSIEQDADVVMFIYRDEIYNPDSTDRGTAEIIIAKHRNGPTGVTQLAFMDHHTRFANMARV